MDFAVHSTANAASKILPPSDRLQGGRRHGFSLVEMLAVMAVIVVLLGFSLPALVSRKGAQDVTVAAHDLAGALQIARTYAIANNTYTWIGFYEQDFNNASAPTSDGGYPYHGVGHVTIGIVYSKDGTKLVEDPKAGSDPKDPTVSTQTLPVAALGQVGKLLHIYGIHLRALPVPTSANSTDPTTSGILQGRPYQVDLRNNDQTAFAQTLISSENGDGETDTTRPFVVQGYTFHKAIRFNPRGEANVDSVQPCTRIIECGLLPTHGNVVDSNSPNGNSPPNVVAVQQAGIGGVVTIYRP